MIKPTMRQIHSKTPIEIGTNYGTPGVFARCRRIRNHPDIFATSEFSARNNFFSRHSRATTRDTVDHPSDREGEIDQLIRAPTAFM